MTVWEQRDLPVLRALAALDLDSHAAQWLSMRPGSRENELGLDLDGGDLYDSILTLGDAGYVEGNLHMETGPSASFTGVRVTGRGHQALGEWPLFDEIASPATLAALLERLAEEAPSDDEADAMRQSARYVGSIGGDALRAIATGALAQLARIAAGVG